MLSYSSSDTVGKTSISLLPYLPIQYIRREQVRPPYTPSVPGGGLSFVFVLQSRRPTTPLAPPSCHPSSLLAHPDSSVLLRLLLLTLGLVSARRTPGPRPWSRLVSPPLPPNRSFLKFFSPRLFRLLSDPSNDLLSLPSSPSHIP